MSSNPTPWLAGRKPAPDAALRLFCFSSAGGAASMYQPWEGRLPARVELCRVQLPGREARFAETPLETFAQLLPQVQEALTPYLDLPFAFFGHSMGALVAFELARRLRAGGEATALALFPSGHRAPHLPMRRRRWAELPKDELVGELKDIDGIPEELLDNEELLEVVLPTVRADLRAYEAYQHVASDPLDCPVTVYSGDRDQLVNEAERSGWDSHTTGPCTVHVLPGKHFFINDERDRLLELLRTDLTALLADLG